MDDGISNMSAPKREKLGLLGQNQKQKQLRAIKKLLKSKYSCLTTLQLEQHHSRQLLNYLLPTVEMMSEMVIYVKQLWQAMKFT